jgi:hypothetical protein
MRIAASRLAPTLGFALLAVACQGAPAPPPDAVAEIGETAVRYGEFERYVQRDVGDTGGVLGSDVLSELFDQFMDERLLTRLAVDRGLVPSARAEAAPRRAIDALLVAGLPREPGDAEVARYYQAHRGELARPERVRLRQILTQDRQAAEAARREVVAGTPFEEVARKLWRGPNAATGGDQGELARGDLPPSFADLIFSLKPGEVSPVVPAEYGFHVFQVVDHLPAEVVPLDAARPEIAAKLRQEGADQLLRSLVQEARSHYNVKVYERNLPFGYQGFYHAKKTR